MDPSLQGNFMFKSTFPPITQERKVDSYNSYSESTTTSHGARHARLPSAHQSRPSAAQDRGELVSAFSVRSVLLLHYRRATELYCSSICEFEEVRHLSSTST